MCENCNIQLFQSNLLVHSLICKDNNYLTVNLIFYHYCIIKFKKEKFRILNEEIERINNSIRNIIKKIIGILDLIESNIFQYKIFEKNLIFLIQLFHRALKENINPKSLQIHISEIKKLLNEIEKINFSKGEIIFENCYQIYEKILDKKLKLCGKL